MPTFVQTKEEIEQKYKEHIEFYKRYNEEEPIRIKEQAEERFEELMSFYSYLNIEIRIKVINTFCEYQLHTLCQSDYGMDWEFKILKYIKDILCK